MTPIRELARIAADAIRDNDSDVAQALQAVREAAFPDLPEPDEDAALREAAQRAALAPDDEAAAIILRGVLSPIRSVTEYRDEPVPKAVLFRDTGRDPDPDRPPRGTILRCGEVAILSGAGGFGKSLLALRFALAAADGGDAAAGFRVEGGPVVLIGYEDSPGEIWRRLMRLREAERRRTPIPDRITVIPNPPALFSAAPDRRVLPSVEWPAIFGAIRALKPILVIVDPASAALADASVSDSGPVRAFLGRLRREAEAGDFGVLVVAHNTKAARNEEASGGNPGAGVVAGSGAWYDAARVVLSMRRDPANPAARLVVVVKANYAASGWGVRLGEVKADPHDPESVLLGFRLADRLNRGEFDAALKGK